MGLILVVEDRVGQVCYILDWHHTWDRVWQLVTIESWLPVSKRHGSTAVTCCGDPIDI